MNFFNFNGIVTMIDDFFIGQKNEVGCYKVLTVDNDYGDIVNFIVKPTTYFVDHVVIRKR
ncbi:hypothetical protein ORD22_11205 [Sporosarcina sp. GW1-11]|uniref:hypothetical protein n=1 Tax=Sporosarcina sp. GW1-11 TaxID=2899126 RepID=UPI00294F1279|nr:hypothetical protein [Sporosarcina sp. GW1-11]MDV6378783.1 hypothetical protein [Sporosarcina sp. GW1-11]